MKQSNYIFTKTENQCERDRLKLIERYHDTHTRKRLRQVGLTVNWKCLEIGPGAGSILRWMAKAVRPHGHVTAVELNPRFISHLKLRNLTIIQGDISRVQLPSETYHLAHARFTFIHTTRYKSALKRVFDSLRPGSWLVLEEPDFSVARAVVGPRSLTRSVQRVNEAIEHMFDAAGLDPAFGIKLPGLLQGVGVRNLAVHHDAPLVQGGSQMATIMKVSSQTLAQKYLATGLATQRDLDRYVRFAEDPHCWAIYHGTVSVIAQKP